MKKNTRGRIYLTALTALTLVVGIGGALILQHVLPEYNFSTYPFIPIYFYVFGLILIFLFERVRRNIQQKTLLLYASIRMMKLMVSIVVLVIYGVWIKIQIKEFLFTFIIFYLIYLIFEILFFFRFELHEAKRLKKRNKTKDNI